MSGGGSGGNLDSLLLPRVGAFGGRRCRRTPGSSPTATVASWSGGPYFAYAHASRAGALDGFMRAFPY